MKEDKKEKGYIFLVVSLMVLISFNNIGYAVVLDDNSDSEKKLSTMGVSILQRGEDNLMPRSHAGAVLLNSEDSNSAKILNIKEASVPSLQKEEYRETSQYAPGEVIVKLRTDSHDFYTQSYSQRKAKDGSVLTGLKSKYNLRDEEPVFKGLHKQLESGDFSLQEQQVKTAAKFPKRARPEDAEKVDLLPIYVLKTDGDVLEACTELNKDPGVEYAEPNYIMEVQMVPDDPYYHSSGSWGQDYDDLWGIKKIQCEQAWDMSQGEGVVVAVIDTGVDYNHEDIAENIWINEGEIPDNGIDDDGNGYEDDIRGWCFSYGNTDLMDRFGHGTHVAGTIAAVGNNSIGVIGVAPRAKIMAVKGLRDDSSGNTAHLADSIEYAVDNGADILNNSWGGVGISQLLEGAFNYAYAAGCVSIAAAGNNNIDVNHFTPANIDSVIAVAATDFDDMRALFSNYGYRIDIAAPGVEVLSLRAEETDMYLGALDYTPGERFVPAFDDNAEYYRSNGTSMACPHVSGLAALILSLHPEFRNEQVWQVLRASSDDIGEAGRDNDSGYGRINADEALQIDDIPVSIITSPKESELMGDYAVVEGSAIRGDAKGYELHYNRLGGAEWIKFADGEAPVGNRYLGRLDLAQLPPSRYEIRLRVHGSSGHAAEDRVRVWGSKQTFFSADLERTEKIFDGRRELVVLTSADFDKNGYPDIVRGRREIIEVYLFDELGIIEPGIPLYVDVTEIEFYGLSTVDIDGDDDSDIIAGNVRGDVYIYRNDGLANFTRELIADYGQCAYALTAGDFDGDGDADIITAQSYEGSFDGTLELLLNDGSGNFTEAGSLFNYHRGYDGSPESMASGDFDNDGDVDFIVGRSISVEPIPGWFLKTYSEILLFRNEGAVDDRINFSTESKGIFGPRDAEQYNPYVAAGDFDQDNDLDIVFGSSSGFVNCLENIGNGDFIELGFIYDFGKSSWGVTAGDFDLDGKTDIMINAMVDSLTSVLTLKRNIYEAPSYHIALTSLNDGGVLNGVQWITWDLVGEDLGISIFYAERDSPSQTWRVVCPNIEDTGEFSWDTSQMPNSEGYIIITATGADGSTRDVSDKPFLISNYPPAPPTKLGATAISSYSIDLTWRDNAGNENGFKIERSLWPDRGFSQIATTNSNITYSVDTGLERDTTYFYRVRAYNGDGNSDYSNVADATTLPNRPPDLESIGNKEIYEGKILQFTVNAKDPDGDLLRYSTGRLPRGARFDRLKRTFTWKPTYDQAGKYPVTFTVSDPGSLTDSETITIKVNNVNRSPDLESIGNKKTDEGKILKFTVNAKDPDGDLLRYSTGRLPRGARFDEGEGSRTFTWKPTYDQAGKYPVTFTVSDPDSLTDSETIIIKVNDANRILTPDWGCIQALVRQK